MFSEIVAEFYLVCEGTCYNRGHLLGNITNVHLRQKAFGIYVSKVSFGDREPLVDCIDTLESLEA